MTALLWPPPSRDMFFLSFTDRKAFRKAVNEEIERQYDERRANKGWAAVKVPERDKHGHRNTRYEHSCTCKESPPSYTLYEDELLPSVHVEAKEELAL